MKVLEFECPECGRWESIEEHEPDELPCPICGAESPWVISAPAIGVQYGTAGTTAKSDPRPPGVLDTRPLAEGMPPHEWHAKTRKKIYSERRDKIRKEIL